MKVFRYLSSLKWREYLLLPVGRLCDLSREEGIFVSSSTEESHHSIHIVYCTAQEQNEIWQQGKCKFFGMILIFQIKCAMLVWSPWKSETKVPKMAGTWNAGFHIECNMKRENIITRKYFIPFHHAALSYKLTQVIELIGRRLFIVQCLILGLNIVAWFCYSLKYTLTLTDLYFELIIILSLVTHSRAQEIKDTGQIKW